MKTVNKPIILSILIMSLLLAASCSTEKKDSEPAATTPTGSTKAEEGAPQKTPAPDGETLKAAEVTGIPAEHMQNYLLGWSKDSAHFGWVEVEKDSEGLLSWRLWVLNVVTGVLPPFGNGSQMAQAAAFTGEEYPDANARNKAAYAFFAGKYIDPLEQQGFSAEAAPGEVLFEDKTLRGSFKGKIENDWSKEFKNAAMEELVLSMNVNVSEKEEEVEKAPADGDAAPEKIKCMVKQSLLKISLAKDNNKIPQLLSPGANYYYGVSAFHPILLSRSPNGSNLLLLLEKFNDAECGQHKVGYVGLEAVGGVIIGTQSAKKAGTAEEK